MTIVVVESNRHYIFSVCVCSVRYPACNARAPYYSVICGLAGYTIFFLIVLHSVGIEKKNSY